MFHCLALSCHFCVLFCEIYAIIDIKMNIESDSTRRTVSTQWREHKGDDGTSHMETIIQLYVIPGNYKCAKINNQSPGAYVLVFR